MGSGIWIAGILKNIRIAMEQKIAKMPGMCMTTGLREGSISQKKTGIFLEEKTRNIRLTGIRKETEHFREPSMDFLRRKTLFIRTRRWQKTEF